MIGNQITISFSNRIDDAVVSAEGTAVVAMGIQFVMTSFGDEVNGFSWFCSHSTSCNS